MTAFPHWKLRSEYETDHTRRMDAMWDRWCQPLAEREALDEEDDDE